MKRSLALTPVFALTFDTELIWGSFDHTTPEAFGRRYPDIRRTIGAILDLLVTYEVPATWAVIGHLFLSSCERGPDGRPHPEVEHPRQSWYGPDWFASDPCSDIVAAPLWYGEDIVDKLLGHRDQEIGCHSFAHALYDDPAMTTAAVRDDLRRCVELAATKGVTLRSFVFPRNREGHHQELRDAGFTSYRAADATWHSRLPHPLGRLGHLFDHVVGVTPPVGPVRERLPGLWEIPGSMVMLPAVGLRRVLTPALRARKARAGLTRAVRTGGVFHLWAHPFIFAGQTSPLQALEMVLRDASALRDRGEITIATMAQIADAATKTADRAEPLLSGP